MFKLNSQVVIGNCQNCQSLIIYFVVPLSPSIFAQKIRQELILKQNYRKHRVLQGVFMSVQLAQHSTQIEVCIR